MHSVLGTHIHWKWYIIAVVTASMHVYFKTTCNCHHIFKVITFLHYTARTSLKWKTFLSEHVSLAVIRGNFSAHLGGSHKTLTCVIQLVVLPFFIMSKCSQRMSPMNGGVLERKSSIERPQRSAPVKLKLASLTPSRLSSLTAHLIQATTCCWLHFCGSVD